MRILLVPVSREAEAGYERVYSQAAEKLRANGHQVTIESGDLNDMPLEEFDLLLTNSRMDDIAVSSRIKAIGTVERSRAADLELLEQHNIETMKWGFARNRLQVLSLFLKWRTTRLILKKSFTRAGRGVSAFRPWHIRRLDWDPGLDIFCAEVSSNDGNVYKAELIFGELLFSWVSVSPPIKKLSRLRMLKKIKGVYGERERVDLPADLLVKLKLLSETQTSRGIGQISVDFMKTRDGRLLSIEQNSVFPAMWWTSQFSDFRERYSNLLVRFVAKIESSNPKDAC